MPNGLPLLPKLLKGALVYFGAPMLIPVPNIIVFQYNPDSMTRTLTPWQPLPRVKPAFEDEAKTKPTAEYKEYIGGLAQPYDPQESFSLVLELDALADGVHPVRAGTTGIAERIAAIEMLMYPPGDSASLSFDLDQAFSAAESNVERRDAPVVLFFWGPGRIVPVRIMSLSIEEQQFNAWLYPVRAKATIGLKVLDLDDLRKIDGNEASKAAVEIAKGCYLYTRGQKEILATANLLNAVDSTVGLPI